MYRANFEQGRLIFQQRAETETEINMVIMMMKPKQGGSAPELSSLKPLPTTGWSKNGTPILFLR